MKKKSIFSPSVVAFSLAISSNQLVRADDLVFEPAEPVVAVGQSIQLAVSGLVSDIYWELLLENTGKIEGSTISTRVTYVAPEQVGTYWINVMGEDSAKQIKSDMISVTVLSPTDCEQHPPCGQKNEQPEPKKAVILIQSNGDGSGDVSQAQTVNFMATYVYETLKDYGYYQNEEIYYLLPNGNRQQGEVINAPATVSEEGATTHSFLTVEAVEAAFEWAKKQELDVPLMLVFIGYGLPNQLILAPSDVEGNSILSEPKLNELLDNYQATTGNQVVVILEASYSGTLLDGLAKANRVIISSTGDGLAFYDNFGIDSFTKFYFEKLREGLDAKDAWEQVISLFKNKELGYPFHQQTPQLKDVTGTVAQQFSLTGKLPGYILRILRIYNGKLIQASIIPYQRIEWRIYKRGRSRQNVSQIKALVKSPEATCQFNHQGYSHRPTEPILFQEEANGEWSAFYENFAINGRYTITFWAEDEHGNLLETQTLYQQVEGEGGEVMQYPRWDGIQLHIPAVTVSNNKGGMDIYQAQLIPQTTSDKLLLKLQSLNLINDTSRLCYVHYNSFNQTVHIPWLEMPDESSTSIQLQFIQETSLFALDGS